MNTPISEEKDAMENKKNPRRSMKRKKEEKMK
jgi:hypothetical protein